MSQSSGNAGYSGKPAWQKLGLSPQLRVLVRGAPGDYAELVAADAASLNQVSPRAAFDLAHVFARDATRLAGEIAALAKKLPASGVLWVSWPKRASGIPSDITEDTVRALALPLGLVDVKVCAIDATWSGLKLMWRRELRAGKPERRG